jgi:hypothetical protein
MCHNKYIDTSTSPKGTGVPAMKIEFSTRPFVLSHGREPSRTTMGSWAFEFEDSKEPWWAPSCSLLGEAKKAAKAEVIRRAGPDGIATVVKILP